MDDLKIIELYFSRNERALEETSAKYGRLLFKIAYNILGNIEDSKECVSDAYLSIWELIPPNRPDNFPAYAARIARNRALKKLEYNSAARRNCQALCSLEELGECVSGADSPESELENSQIEWVINSFLGRQSREKRNIFIWRYWFFMPVGEIAHKCGCSESRVKSILFNMRKKLRTYLESEGIEV